MVVRRASFSGQRRQGDGAGVGVDLRSDSDSRSTAVDLDEGQSNAWSNDTQVDARAVLSICGDPEAEVPVDFYYTL
jgi:hypothetical protein